MGEERVVVDVPDGVEPPVGDGRDPARLVDVQP
jgi:hypothetical protein